MTTRRILLTALIPVLLTALAYLAFWVAADTSWGHGQAAAARPSASAPTASTAAPDLVALEQQAAGLPHVLEAHASLDGDHSVRIDIRSDLPADAPDSNKMAEAIIQATLGSDVTGGQVDTLSVHVYAAHHLAEITAGTELLGSARNVDE